MLLTFKLIDTLANASTNNYNVICVMTLPSGVVLAQCGVFNSPYSS